jgi:2-polyprenyl-6-methoxyphenol hydroxylase-like FAD-dependent oxidoreductase
MNKLSSPKPLNILIIGAGCAGPALALLLRRTNPKHTITVIERFPSLRTGGQQLDLKFQGITVAEKLRVLEDIKAACVHETGMQLVDKNGASLMQFGINPASKTSAQGIGLTNEYEIMRGDMVKVFYDASLAENTKIGERGGSLSYHFDTTITALEQTPNGADVTFSNSSMQHFDLVVAADGQNSRTRRMAFGDDINTKSFRPLGVHAAYFNVPRIPSDHTDAKIYFAPGSRMVMTRTGDRDVTQVYLFIMKDKPRHELFKSIHKQSLAQQKDAWIDVFADAGWECERFMQGLKVTEDFYAHEIGQVHMPQLYSGRIVLLGDAGYCPSPFTGMGTTLSLVGAYILAGELAKHGDAVDEALKAYHEGMQLPLEKYQRLAGPGGSDTGFYPSSELGIKMVNAALWTVSNLRIDKLVRWIVEKLPEGKDEVVLPEYPELSLEGGEKM